LKPTANSNLKLGNGKKLKNKYTKIPRNTKKNLQKKAPTELTLQMAHNIKIIHKKPNNTLKTSKNTH